MKSLDEDGKSLFVNFYFARLVPKLIFNKKILKIKKIAVFASFSASFTLHSAGSCFEKNYMASNFNLSTKIDIPLRPDGVACGEDDFFIAQKDNLRFLTVADGAGGWRDKGIDSKLFIADFLDIIEEKSVTLSEENANQLEAAGNRVLLKLVEDSLKEVEAVKENIHYGSGTIASMSLNMDTLTANWYHLGDAGYTVIRKQKASKFLENLTVFFNLKIFFRLFITQRTSDMKVFSTSLI